MDTVAASFQQSHTYEQLNIQEKLCGLLTLFAT